MIILNRPLFTVITMAARQVTLFYWISMLIFRIKMVTTVICLRFYLKHCQGVSTSIGSLEQSVLFLDLCFSHLAFILLLFQRCYHIQTMECSCLKNFKIPLLNNARNYCISIGMYCMALPRCQTLKRG